MTKKNLILGGILAGLLILVFVYQVPYKNWQKNHGKPNNFLSGANIAEIDKIELVRNGEVMVLERKDDKWLIGGTRAFYVEPEIVSAIETNLEEAKNNDIKLVSSNADNRDNFDINEEVGMKVKLVDGENVLANFIVGKNTPDFQGTYISQTDSDKVYSTGANLRSVFVRDDWYNKEIFSVDKEQISKIRFQYEDEGFTIEKEEDGWIGLVPYKFSVDDEKIEGVLDVMSALKAERIPTQSFEGTGLEKNLIIVQAMGEGIDYTIMVGDENEDGLYYAKKSENDNIYLISKEDRDELKKDFRDLR